MWSLHVLTYVALTIAYEASTIATPQFTDEEMEAQKGSALPRGGKWQICRWDLNPDNRFSEITSNY